MGNEGKGDPAVRALGRNKPDRNWYPDNFDWYLKWVASVIVLCSLALRSAGPEYRIYDLLFGAVGIALWTWVFCYMARQGFDNVKRHIIFYVKCSNIKGDIDERLFCSQHDELF